MTQYKRTKIKRGTNSWTNVTTRQNGTSSRSFSNKVGNTTTNVSSKGVRRTQNNNGWIKREYWPAVPKIKTKSTKPYSYLWKRKKNTTKNKVSKDYSSTSTSAPTLNEVVQQYKEIFKWNPKPKKTEEQKKEEESQFMTLLVVCIILVVLKILIFGV